MKLPKLWRVKRADAEIGNLHVTVKGRRVNLGTLDEKKAKKRAAEAVRAGGKIKFPKDDTDGAADAIMAAVGSAGGAETPPVVEPPPPEPEPLPGPENGGGGPAPDPVATDYARPGAGFADAVNSAAGAQTPTAAAPDPAQPPIPPEFLEQLIRGAALNAVTMQLALQGWAAARWKHVDVNPVPADNMGVQLGAQMWATWFRTLIPTDLSMIPPWLAAPALVLMFTIGPQLRDAKPIDPDAEKKPAGEAEPAAAS